MTILFIKKSYYLYKIWLNKIRYTVFLDIENTNKIRKMRTLDTNFQGQKYEKRFLKII